MLMIWWFLCLTTPISLQTPLNISNGWNWCCERVALGNSQAYIFGESKLSLSSTWLYLPTSPPRYELIGNRSGGSISQDECQYGGEYIKLSTSIIASSKFCFSFIILKFCYSFLLCYSLFPNTMWNDLFHYEVSIALHWHMHACHITQQCCILVQTILECFRMTTP